MKDHYFWNNCIINCISFVAKTHKGLTFHQLLRALDIFVPGQDNFYQEPEETFAIASKKAVLYAEIEDKPDNRLQYNLKVLKLIENVAKKHKELRFQQILQILRIVGPGTFIGTTNTLEDAKVWATPLLSGLKPNNQKTIEFLEKTRI